MQIQVKADDGTLVNIEVPLNLPSEERAEELRELYTKHVKHNEGHWKGPCWAVVPTELADDVAEAMNFMGSIVDARNEFVGSVLLSSRGYSAHGF